MYLDARNYQNLESSHIHSPIPLSHRNISYGYNYNDHSISQPQIQYQRSPIPLNIQHFNPQQNHKMYQNKASFPQQHTENITQQKYNSNHHRRAESKYQTKAQQIQTNKKYHQQALDNFPFGKEGLKLAHYVNKQLNSSQTDENARILLEFRKKAVESKFNKYSQKSQKARELYITENMLPGISNNPTMAEKMDLQPQLKKKIEYIGARINSLKRKQQSEIRKQQDQIAYMSNNQSPYNKRYQTMDLHQSSHNRYQNSNSFLHNPSLHCQIQQPIINSNYRYQNPYVNGINPQLQNSQLLKLKISRSAQTPLKTSQEVEAHQMKKKYYKLKIKNIQKEEKYLNKLEKIMKNMNSQILQNSQYLKKAINENKGYQRRRMKSEQKESARSNSKKKYQSWKLNSQLITDDTQQSFYKGKYKKTKPKVQYSQAAKLAKGDSDNFEDFFTNKLKSKNNLAFSTIQHTPSQQRLKERGRRDDMNLDKMREHLKLLKKHSIRLQTLSSANYD